LARLRFWPCCYSGFNRWQHLGARLDVHGLIEPGILPVLPGNAIAGLFERQSCFPVPGYIAIRHQVFKGAMPTVDSSARVVSCEHFRRWVDSWGIAI
jgi:hypothetical protein